VRVAGKLGGSENDEDRARLLRWADELLSGEEPAGAPREARRPVTLRLPLAIHKVFKHKRYEATLLPGWRVRWGEKVFGSVSAAAIAITGTNQNGWRFWRYVEPYTGEEHTLEHLRDTTGSQLLERVTANKEFVASIHEGLAAAERGEKYRLGS
jgi:hypothetical protein